MLLVDGRPVFGIIIEVQLRRDDGKLFSWPVYTAGLRARIRCPVALLVVAPNSRVANWAAQAIWLGPASVFTPLVLGAEAVPAVVDPAEAEADPELAVLSIMAHGRGNVELAVRIAQAATTGVRTVRDHDRVVLYSDAIQAALSAAARKAFEMIPPGYVFQSKLARDSFKRGRNEGRVESQMRAILAVLKARGLELSPAQRERITSCTDLRLLGRWLRRAATSPTIDAVFSK